MEFFLPWWGTAKMALVAFAAVLVLSPFVYLYGHHAGTVAERAAIQGEIAKRTAKILKQRANDDAEIRNFSERELCLDILPDGLPISACD